MHRLLAPSLGVAALALLIGCGGGGGSPSFGDDVTNTSGGPTSAGNATSGGLGQLAAPGTYAVTLTGTGTTGTTYAGTGTGTAATDGTLTLDYTSVQSGATPVTTTRRLVATVASSGVATGALTIGSNAPLATTGLLTRASDGSPRLTANSTQGQGESATTESDLFALTLRRPAAGTYGATANGTDDRNGVYTGSGTLIVPTTGNLTGPITVYRRIGSAQVGQVYTLSAALATDGTLSGTLVLPNNFGSLATTGRIAQSTAGVPQLVLSYVTTGSPSYRVALTLTLTRR